MPKMFYKRAVKLTQKEFKFLGVSSEGRIKAELNDPESSEDYKNHLYVFYLEDMDDEDLILFYGGRVCYWGYDEGDANGNPVCYVDWKCVNEDEEIEV